MPRKPKDEVSEADAVVETKAEEVEESGTPTATGKFYCVPVKGGFRIVNPAGQWASPVLDEADANNKVSRFNSFRN